MCAWMCMWTCGGQKISLWNSFLPLYGFWRLNSSCQLCLTGTFTWPQPHFLSQFFVLDNSTLGRSIGPGLDLSPSLPSNFPLELFQILEYDNNILPFAWALLSVNLDFFSSLYAPFQEMPLVFLTTPPIFRLVHVCTSLLKIFQWFPVSQRSTVLQ